MREQSEYCWRVKCNGPMSELSLPYVLQTFIFMGPGYSLGTLAVKCYIRVLHETKCAEGRLLDSNEKEKTSA